MILLLGACARVAALLPGAASSDAPLECPSGSTWTVEPPGEGDARTLSDTEVHTCRDGAGRAVGPHLERWPEGGTACLGAWVDGERDGVWLTWHPDGAFRSQVGWSKGRQHGPRREVGLEGRLVELAMEDGECRAMVTLPPDLPMPEWDDGARVEGTRYRAVSR